jgi:proteasome lid subunit RPN8/RPN11
MITIPSTILYEIIRHAREGAPLEVCGILGGPEEEVSTLYRISNTDADPRHFTMDPAQQIEAFRNLECAGLEVIAFYHSHPLGPDHPSPEDIRLAFYPDVLSVIVSLAEPDRPVVNCFRIADGNVEPVEIRIIQGKG